MTGLGKDLPTGELERDLYDALRSLACRALSPGSRFDATDLVHQAWVRLARSEVFAGLSRAEFLALSATMMRRIAVDEGRRRALEQAVTHESITLGATADEHDEVDLIALDEGLDALGEVDERWARIVELRFFAGMTSEEVAQVMGLTRRTVTRDWTLARAWLKRRLS